MSASSPVQGFAIKGPDGAIRRVCLVCSEDDAWYVFNEPWHSRDYTKQEWVNSGHTCVPVAITEALHTARQSEPMRVAMLPRETLNAAEIWLRGTLTCKDFHWDADQKEAATDVCDALAELLAEHPPTAHQSQDKQADSALVDAAAIRPSDRALPDTSGPAAGEAVPLPKHLVRRGMRSDGTFPMEDDDRDHIERAKVDRRVSIWTAVTYGREYNRRTATRDRREG